jgi:hypothetical protein
LSLVEPLPPPTDDGEMGEDGDAAVGASGEEPAHPTTSALADNSNSNDDFIRLLSLRPIGPTVRLVYEQEMVPLIWRPFLQSTDVQSTRGQTYCPRGNVLSGFRNRDRVLSEPAGAGLFTGENGLIAIAVAVRDGAEQTISVHVVARHRHARQIRGGSNQVRILEPDVNR